MRKERFTVWVGGVEVNDSYLTIEQARVLKKIYLNQGYKDVIVEEII
jgi:hypothetical protein